MMRNWVEQREIEEQVRGMSPWLALRIAEEILVQLPAFARRIEDPHELYEYWKAVGKLLDLVQAADCDVGYYLFVERGDEW